jgi:hypothetical protein
MQTVIKREDETIRRESKVQGENVRVRIVYLNIFIGVLNVFSVLTLTS